MLAPTWKSAKPRLWSSEIPGGKPIRHCMIVPPAALLSPTGEDHFQRPQSVATGTGHMLLEEAVHLREERDGVLLFPETMTLSGFDDEFEVLARS